VSTRCGNGAVPGVAPGLHFGIRSRDPAEAVALVAATKRELVLRSSRHLLRWEDLEDCYSQATLELMSQAQRGATFVDRAHLANTLELRFASRVRDLRRALAGRSPIQMALASAVSLGGAGEQEITLADRRAEVERRVLLREELRQIQRLAGQLTSDQVLVLACQVGLQMGCADFCCRFGWSSEKYRKVAQRARRRLAQLIEDDASCVPPAGASRNQPQGPTYD
jgi:DNA-directed RNA polymerase specialized sigma24 family protein